MLHRLEIRLHEIRNETSFEDFIEKAKILAEKVEATIEFTLVGRPRARKTFFNREVEDDRKNDAKMYLKKFFLLFVRYCNS
jgi:hypothetical protein